MERPERVPQLYGYTVCLIALIWGLTSLVSIVEDALSLSAPELRTTSEFSIEPSVTSFEAFRVTNDRARRMNAGERVAQLDSVPEAQLRQQYEGLRADRIQRGRYSARRELITGALSLAICIVLFTFHWRWLQRRTNTSGSAGAT